jgi:predicted SnoaL-like aldol condensation-catalyzing enzyme
MQKSEILNSWYARVWEQGDIEAIDEVFRPDTKAAGLLPDMRLGPDDFKELVAMVQELVEEIRAQIVKTVEDGDWLAALVRIHTTNSITGEQVTVSGQVMARFEGDIMVETYNAFDFLSFFEQMHLLPEQVLPICLSGQRVG